MLKSKIGVVILAAGKGKRMQSELPKVMHLLRDRPLIDYVVSNVEKFGLKPVVVVAPDSYMVRDYLGRRAIFAIQEKQLGTGHAVASAESKLKDNVEHVVVLNGDHPFITPAAIRRLIDEHLAKGNELTLMTVKTPDFFDWREQFYDFGRIIRDTSDNIVRIIEKKDASPKELNIRELNAQIFCFQADWLWTNLKKIENKNAQGEFLLTDLVKFAFDEGARLSSIDIDPHEAIGINTKEHLEKAHSIK